LYKDQQPWSAVVWLFQALAALVDFYCAFRHELDQLCDHCVATDLFGKESRRIWDRIVAYCRPLFSEFSFWNR